MPEKTPWSELDDNQQLDRLAQVLKRASEDDGFREACLDENTGPETIANEAQVTFDNGVTIRGGRDKSTVAQEILLLLPETPAPLDDPYRAENGAWICSYTTYGSGSAAAKVARNFAGGRWPDKSGSKPGSSKK
jgi:hypothetical protein